MPMTVADVIRELQGMPQELPVKVLLSHVWCQPYMVDLNETEAGFVLTVRHRDGFVLIESL